MIKFLKRWIDNNLFEILVISSIVIIIVLALFRIHKQGTWSDTYYYLPNQNSTPVLNNKCNDSNFTSKGELKCRQFLEKYFNYKYTFSKSRPNFMSNQVTGGKYNLELDCYNPELQLAVEYNGEQHYKYVEKYYKNKENALEKQQARDEEKVKLCKEYGIYLIVVPYFEKDKEKLIETEYKKYLEQKKKGNKVVKITKKKENT